MECQENPSMIHIVSLPHTRSAFTCLKNCLQCRKWSCAQDRKGKTCPVCSMPTHATQAHVDKQLSSIASLCLQMSDLLNGEYLSSVIEKNRDDEAIVKQAVTVTSKRNRGSKYEIRPSSLVDSHSRELDSVTSPVTTKDGCYESGETSRGQPNRKRKPEKDDTLIVEEKPIASRARSLSKVKENRGKSPVVTLNGQNISCEIRRSECNRKKQPEKDETLNVEIPIASGDESLSKMKENRVKSTVMTIDGQYESGETRNQYNRKRKSEKDETFNVEETPIASGATSLSKVKENIGKSIVMTIDGQNERGEIRSQYNRKRKPEKDDSLIVEEKPIVSGTRSHSKVTANKLVPPNAHDADGIKATACASLRRQKRISSPQDLQAGESSTGEGRETLPTTPKSSQVKETMSERKTEKSIVKSRRKSNTFLTKRNAKGETPLQVATIKADVETVRNLLEEGANPNVRDNAGWTPLHEAVNHGNATIAELLINYGASVNAPGLDNDSPLHDAVINYRLECVRLLMTKGANALARNIHGQTPLGQAQTDEMREILLATDGSAVVASDINTSMNQSKDHESDQPLCFVGTALAKAEQAMLLKCAKLLNAKAVDEFSSEVTHLITGVNAEGMCPRTLKYLNVLLAGKWVVSSTWLKTCLECGSKAPEEDLEIAGCTNNPNTMAPMKARQNALSQLPGLFDGCQFYFQGKFNRPTPSREELASLVKIGGGVILTREPRLYSLDDYPYTVPFHATPTSSLADCSIFVIYDDTCQNPPYVEAQRMTCLPASWIMDSIASFSLLDKNLYSKN